MRYIGFRDLKALYGIPYGWAQLGRLEAAGAFPRRVRLSPKRVAWVRTEIEGWCEAREKGREAA